jgi:hypothetical protein
MVFCAFRTEKNFYRHRKLHLPQPPLPGASLPKKKLAHQEMGRGGFVTNSYLIW